MRGTAAASGALSRLVLGPSRRQLEERVEVLAQTRAGAVDAAAAELQRIERDLHDGAQARLVALALDLGMAEERFDRDPEGARELVEKARGEAKLAMGELRDLARGIRPALLSERGLAEAIGALAARTPLPTSVDVDLDGRLPAPVELAAYFTVAEALTNAVKHAQARSAKVRVCGARTAACASRCATTAAAAPTPTATASTACTSAWPRSTARWPSPRPPGGPTVLYAEVPCAS